MMGVYSAAPNKVPSSDWNVSALLMLRRVSGLLLPTIHFNSYENV